MSTPLKKYHILLFINGSKVGENGTFADWFASDADAIAGARDYFTAEGYHVESVTVSHGEVLPANRFTPALHGLRLTVRLTTQA